MVLQIGGKERSLEEETDGEGERKRGDEREKKEENAAICKSESSV